jgi:hypothetical protein
MKKTVATIALGALACIATPASATQMVLGLTGSSGLTGTDGNGRLFSITGGGTTLNVRASGWAIEGSAVRDSFLGAFDAGLGVTSGDDADGADNRHAVDNHTRKDFIVLQFDQAVELVSAKFTTYSILGLTKDSDATIAYGTSALNWQTHPAMNDANVSVLNSMFSGSFTSLGTVGGGTRNLGTGTARGNLWLIGADFVNADGNIDGFKLSNLTINTPAVPEPASWAMMISGFGLVGGAMRRRSTMQAAVA